MAWQLANEPRPNSSDAVALAILPPSTSRSLTRPRRSTQSIPSISSRQAAKNLSGTHEAGAAKVQDYLDRHVAIAGKLDKPLVIEKFGYPRNGGSYDPAATTAFKDRFYAQVFAAVLAGARSGGPVAGSNFLAWNGEVRAAHADYAFRQGDRSYLGDPPHEPQGWYGVFSFDRSTQALVREHASELAATA